MCIVAAYRQAGIDVAQCTVCCTDGDVAAIDLHQWLVKMPLYTAILTGKLEGKAAMNYQKLLVPVDFSAISGVVLDRAAEIAGSTGATVTVVHVVDYVPPAHIWPELPEIYCSESELSKRAKKQLTELTDLSTLVDCEVIVKVGNAKDMIVALQKDINADLILMARHSHRGLERLLGSTSHSVVQKANCDVLLLNH